MGGEDRRAQGGVLAVGRAVGRVFPGLAASAAACDGGRSGVLDEVLDGEALLKGVGARPCELPGDQADDLQLEIVGGLEVMVLSKVVRWA